MSMRLARDFNDTCEVEGENEATNSPPLKITDVAPSNRSSWLLTCSVVWWDVIVLNLAVDSIKQRSNVSLSSKAK